MSGSCLITALTGGTLSQLVFLPLLFPLPLVPSKEMHAMVGAPGYLVKMRLWAISAPERRWVVGAW